VTLISKPRQLTTTYLNFYLKIKRLRIVDATCVPRDATQLRGRAPTPGLGHPSLDCRQGGLCVLHRFFGRRGRPQVAFQAPQSKPLLDVTPTTPEPVPAVQPNGGP
jgi:hypothetical protein